MTREERIEISSNEYFANANEQISAHIAYRAALNSPLAQELQEEDAIGFAEWLRDNCNNSCSASENLWYHTETDAEYTSKKAFQIYKSSKK